VTPHASKPNARERLLAAGAWWFAERGFRASLRDITRAAHCNIAAVNYYFRSKDGLYREVLAHLFTNLREPWLASIRGVMQSPQPSVDLLLERLARSFVDLFALAADGRRCWQLLTHELLAPRLGDTLRAELVEPTLRELAAALVALDPRLSAVTARRRAEAVIAQLHYLVHPELLDGHGEAELEARLRHAVRFASAALHALQE
jgi:AcrR family transcriptional regulator